MAETLTASQVVEAMVEYVRRNLELDDKRPEGTKDVVTFAGKGITEKDAGVSFALEVIVNIRDVNNALRWDYFDETVRERSSPRLKNRRTYTALLFPKSIHHERARAWFESPYCKPSNLLDAMPDGPLKQVYAGFGYNNVKLLSRMEFQYAVPVLGTSVAYFNPSTGAIQVHRFGNFHELAVIPVNRPITQEYLWRWIRKGRFPIPQEEGRMAEVFRGIQQGAHDEVKYIFHTDEIKGQFTLERYSHDKTQGASRAQLKSYKPTSGLLIFS